MFLQEITFWLNAVVIMVSNAELSNPHTHRMPGNILLEFSAFLKFHNDLRRKHADLRVYADQLDRYVEQYRTDLARKDKKIQSQR